jgi:CHAT domain-containing protein
LRDGQIRELTLTPGQLGVSFHKEPAPVALSQGQKLKEILNSTHGLIPKPLPGTRREVTALAALFPTEKAHVLLGSEACEQKLDELVSADLLKNFRLLHFATHGLIDPVFSAHSALLLATDKLPDEVEQVRQGHKVYTGRLTVEAMSNWKLNADLVTLSACETGLGKHAECEGLLGFSQVLFAAGARSLVLSLWKVEDTATALLMTRFYENLLGKREGLNAPLGRGEALREAKKWLRTLPKAQAEALASKLKCSELRGTSSPLKPLVKPEIDKPGEKEERPYAHPFYWSAFILLGDPD